MSEFYGARIERGAGRVIVPRLPYAVDPSLAALAPFDRIVLVGAKPPVAFFAYPGKPGKLSRADCQCIELATPEHDLEQTLRALCEALGAGIHGAAGPGRIAERIGSAARAAALAGSGLASAALPDGTLDAAGIGRVLAALIPDNAIVVDEAVSTGRGFDGATVGAAPHDWLTGCGGSIGFALPVAVGAAIAAPDRKVLALEGDGSGMYTLQSLWTMVREGLNVTLLIFANRSYQILRGEFSQVGAGVPGQRATDMLSLDRPTLDWVTLARGMGMQASRASDLASLGKQLQHALAADGPCLVEVIL